jgi:hypothetical protein
MLRATDVEQTIIDHDAAIHLDPREVENYVTGLPPRRELIYRLAVRRLCGRCRGDRRFTERTQGLMQQFGADLVEVTAEAAELERELTEG